MKTPVEKREPRRIKSIEVGFRILRALEQEQRKLPLKDIAARVVMPASNAYLYLMSFVHEGMVEQDAATGHYSLGAFAIQLGAASLRQSSLIEIAKDLLTGLRNDTRNSVYLSVWGNRGPTIVFKIDGDEYGPLGIRVGHVLPILGTATGRVFLSYLGDDATLSLVEQERTSSIGLAGTVNDRIRNAVVSDIAKKVRTDGYAHTDAVLSGGYAASAAPVFDQSGEICAAITILRPESGLSLPADRVNSRLVETARELSSKLGWLASTAGN